MKYSLVAFLFALMALSGCGDADDPTRRDNFTPLTSIEISAENSQIANLTSTQMRAIGNFSGLFTRDITADVVWASLDPSVATVGTTTGIFGRATGVLPGSTSISATLDGITDSFNLTVSNATISSLALSPLAPTIPKGLTAQFAATGSFSDGTTQDLSFNVAWSSSNDLAATISNAVGSKGLASTVDVGTSTITATFDGMPASTVMTVSAASLVSMTLSPLTPSILNLSSGQMSATGTFSDASTLDITDQVAWASSLPAVATISNTASSEGLISTLSAGSTSISATMDGVSAATGLTVSGGDLASIQVSPANTTYIHISPVIPLQMSAAGSFDNAARDISTEVTWSSSDEAVATIDFQGVVTTVGAGTTVIKAVYDTLEGTTDLTVVVATFTSGTLVVAPATATLPTIAVGTSLQFTANGDFSDGSTRDLTSVVTWTSSAAAATVSSSAGKEGVVNGVAAGTTSITADFSGETDFSDLSVTAPTLVTVSIDTLPPSLLAGQSLQLRATAAYSDATTQDITADVTWTSADTSVAIFHDALKANGEIMGVDSGSAEITLSFGGMTETVTVTVP